MIAWMLVSTLASAGAPEGVDLEDYDLWADAADQFREGPDGCWEMEGKLYLKLSLDGGASMMGLGGVSGGEVTGRASGRIEDHEWTKFHYTLDKEREPWMVIRPMWGSVQKGAIVAVDDEGNPLPEVGPTKEERAQMRQRAKRFGMGRSNEEGGDAIQTSTVEYTEWDEETREVRLVQEVLVEGMGQGEAVATHHFPEGERFVSAVDIELPKTATFGRWPLRGSIQRASAHLRGHRVGEQVLPLAQRFSAIVGFFGQTVAADSALTFVSARPCQSEPESVEEGDSASETDVPSESGEVADDASDAPSETDVAGPPAPEAGSEEAAPVQD